MVRKNILIVAPYGFVDRLTNYIEFIAARHLVKNEWSVTAIVQSLDTNRSSTDSVSGIRVFRYGTLLAGAFLFCRYLLSGRPDIVHVHNLRNNRLAFGVAMVTTVKFDDDIPSGISPGQTDGTHGGFRAGVHHPDFFH